jgi:type II secretory pathway pseudopilin PulG
MLIAALLPSLCRSSETANRVKCASNLRQIGQAIALYARDNGGHVEWIDNQSWPSVAAAAGVAVVPSLTTRP